MVTTVCEQRRTGAGQAASRHPRDSPWMLWRIINHAATVRKVPGGVMLNLLKSALQCRDNGVGSVCWVLQLEPAAHEGLTPTSAPVSCRLHARLGKRQVEQDAGRHNLRGAQGQQAGVGGQEASGSQDTRAT